uniref:Cutinase n=1 Tax=Bionectria ochroleuca TaxID=29856 RepID=A0A8H7TSQ3_BIOOC
MQGLRSLALAGLVAAGLVSSQTTSKQCVKGLKIFVGRGTGEPLVDAQNKDTTLIPETGLGNNTRGLGETGKLLMPIFDKIPDSNYTAILYTASNGRRTTNESNYFESVFNGTAMVRKAMTEYATACPDGKMAWIGYSQGAQIISNSLCGMPVIWAQFMPNPSIPEMISFSQPLPTNVTKNVIATLLLGDPSHKNSTNYNYGSHNLTGDGVFYRGDTGACDALGKRIRSYCDAGDVYCDVGPAYSDAHVRYVKDRKEELVNYIVEQWKNGGETGEVSTTNTRSGASPSTTDDAGSGAQGLARASSFALILSLVLLLLI